MLRSSSLIQVTKQNTQSTSCAAWSVATTICSHPLYGIYGTFSISALISLENFIFDLSTSKWEHGSPMWWASFLLIFCLPCPSILNLRSGTGQTEGWTDRQTDNSHQCFMPQPYGVRRNNQKLVQFTFSHATKPDKSRQKAETENN